MEFDDYDLNIFKKASEITKCNFNDTKTKNDLITIIEELIDSYNILKKKYGDLEDDLNNNYIKREVKYLWEE